MNTQPPGLTEDEVKELISRVRAGTATQAEIIQYTMLTNIVLQELTQALQSEQTPTPSGQ